ncbi:MAG: hypothetical protein JSV03_06385, partial [Planctomycetota bacterium]
CTEVTLSECNTLGGTYHGAYTSCSDPSIICCPTPFADADGDGDVDQDDFAEFQQCFTGDEGGIPAGCECFNRDDFEDTIKDIDIDDYAQFQNCATGPSVPFEAGNPPAGCTP